MSLLSEINGYYPAVALDTTRVHLAWEQRNPDPEIHYSVWYARLVNGVLEEPRPVSGTVRYAEVPNIAKRGKRIVITFQSKQADGTVRIYLVQSLDNGNTWNNL